MIEDLILNTRSYRRFIEEPINKETLLSLVNLARLSASGANLQPLKYIISHGKEMNSKIFPHLMWAGYLKDWRGPDEGERPSAYIIVLGDKSISNSFGCDHGIASQNILLGATEKGLGCCIIGAVDRKGIMSKINIPDKYEILHIIAIGKPGEKIVLDKIEKPGDIRYWRDEAGIHHVPKRALDEIVVTLDS